MNDIGKQGIMQEFIRATLFAFESSHHFCKNIQNLKKKKHIKYRQPFNQMNLSNSLGNKKPLAIVKIWKIQTPRKNSWNLNIVLPYSNVSKDADGMANSIDPDEQSDLGVYCLPRPACCSLRSSLFWVFTVCPDRPVVPWGAVSSECLLFAQTCLLFPDEQSVLGVYCLPRPACCSLRSSLFWVFTVWPDLPVVPWWAVCSVCFCLPRPACCSLMSSLFCVFTVCPDLPVVPWWAVCSGCLLFAQTCLLFLEEQSVLCVYCLPRPACCSLMNSLFWVFTACPDLPVVPWWAVCSGCLLFAQTCLLEYLGSLQ